MASRLNMVMRLTNLIERLRSCHMMPPLRELAQDVGVSTRTVVRYLDALEYAGYPLPQRPEGWWVA